MQDLSRLEQKKTGTVTHPVLRSHVDHKDTHQFIIKPMTAKKIGLLEVLMTPKIRAAVVCKTRCMARFGPLKTVRPLLASKTSL